MRKLIVVLVLFAAACGGDQGRPPAATPATGGAGTPGTPAAAVPAARPATGQIHDVKMELVKGKYLFTPATLTIKQGDAVRWHNLGGGPHNVQFKKDRIPAGAQEVLNAAMPKRIADLTGPFIIDTLATYEMSFAGAPAGSYAYTCQPHEVLGMNALLTVQR